MRENRMYGSEGGEPGNRASLPLSSKTGATTLQLHSEMTLPSLRDSGTR